MRGRCNSTETSACRPRHDLTIPTPDRALHCDAASVAPARPPRAVSIIASRYTRFGGPTTVYVAIAEKPIPRHFPRLRQGTQGLQRST
jgi:hypothetical protein